MSMATAMKWKAVDIDLTQGFIQAKLPKDGKAIYISPPPGHVEEPDVLYQVLKPLYGMPHSGRCLHVTWSKWLEGQGFQKAGYEGAMWSRKDSDGDTILVATHVDDSIVSPTTTRPTPSCVKCWKDSTAPASVTSPKCSVWSGNATSRRALAFCIRGPSRERFVDHVKVCKISIISTCSLLF
jgi:hypothetical protein